MNNGRIPLIGIERLRMGVDGPGVRTLIGTAGCPLRCRYCLNPQSWDGTKQIHRITPEELYDEIRIDNLYFLSTGGGVTFGGGEPLMHMDSITAFRELCPKEWSFWLETSLQGEEKAIRLAAAVFDYFIVDIKTADPEIYRQYTGGDGERAIRNLKLLCDIVGPERITVRMPLIPGFADEISIKETAGKIAALGIENLDYLTYLTDTDSV